MTAPVDVVTLDVFSATRLPWRELPLAQRQELCEWLERHGVDSALTFAVRAEMVDGPVLVCQVHVLDDDGRLVIDADGQLVDELVDVLVDEPLPEWWRPAVFG